MAETHRPLPLFNIPGNVGFCTEHIYIYIYPPPCPQHEEECPQWALSPEWPNGNSTIRGFGPKTLRVLILITQHATQEL